MKALIISDIHSNIDALEAIWAREGDSDVIYCAGDLVDYGPEPGAAIAWVRERGAICVQGNHDQRVAACYRAGALGAPSDADEWRHHNARLLDDDDVAFLEALPPALAFTLDGVRYGMTHLYQDYQLITNLHTYERFCQGLLGETPPRLIMGHTHRQALHYLSDATAWVNPGSVSYRRPDDPDQTAHYITITDGVASLRRTPYDVDAVFRKLQGIPLAEREMRVARWFFGPAAARPSHD